MASLLDEVVNPFTKSGPWRLFEALKTGPISGKDLVESYRCCKTFRQIANVAGVINRLDGMRVRCAGNPADGSAMWSMAVVNPASILVKLSAASLAAAHSTPLPTGPVPEPTFKGSTATAKKGSLYCPPPDYGWFKEMLASGANIFLVGPSGSGKSTMAVEGAKETKAIYIRQNFDGETTVDNMVGYTSIGIEDGTSVTQWQDGELARAARLAAKGERVVYCCDEVTAGKPDVLFKFHRVLELLPDGSREMEVNGELIKIPPGKLSFVATGNSFRMDESGLYAGTNTMNDAFLNRWEAVFYVDYPPNEDEIMEKRGVDKKIAAYLKGFAIKVRKEARERNYPITLSTRELVTIGLKAMQFGCKKALIFCYVNKLLTDERKIVDPIIITIPWPN